MKKLFEFDILKEQTVKETETSKNDKGEEIQITKDVKKKIPQKFCIKKPNRGLFDEAELFYAVKLSEGIRAGLLTRALLSKRYENDGGPLSQTEIDRFGVLYSEYFEKQREIQRLLLKESKTDEEVAELKDLNEEQEVMRRGLQQFEMDQASLYDQTAEVRARNKTILWWILNLAHSINDKGEERPVFKGASFEEKLQAYDTIIETEDAFNAEIVQKFTYFISFWYVGKASTPEDFKSVADDLDPQPIVKNAPEVKVEVKFEAGAEVAEKA